MSRTLKQLQADSEAVSRLYARRFNINRDDDWQLLKLQEEVGELTSAYLRLTGRGRLKGAELETIRQAMRDELADCLAQIVLIAEHFDIDLDQAIENKWFQHLEAARADI